MIVHLTDVDGSSAARHEDLSRVRLIQPGKHFQQGGLARTVGANQSNPVSNLDVNRHVREREGGRERLFQDGGRSEAGIWRKKVHAMDSCGSGGTIMADAVREIGDQITEVRLLEAIQDPIDQGREQGVSCTLQNKWLGTRAKNILAELAQMNLKGAPLNHEKPGFRLLSERISPARQSRFERPQPILVDNSSP